MLIKSAKIGVQFNNLIKSEDFLNEISPKALSLGLLAFFFFLFHTLSDM